MAQSTDVNLPRDHKVRFPDRCVVCGRNEPGSHVRLITGTLGWWTWLLWWIGKPIIVRAPACRVCGWKLHLRRLLSLMLTVCVVSAAFWFAWPYFKDLVPHGLRKWAMMGLAIVCLLPQLLVEVLFVPPSFDVTAHADNVDYEFKSQGYALEFAILNDDANWVKVNGHLLAEEAGDEEI
jgi:hypothetical protein